MRKAVKRYKNRVAELPCAVCGREGVQLHHLREGQGIGQRSADLLVIPLCPDCHLGPNGFHGLGRRGFEARYRTTEMELLAATLEKLL
jgi:hypothetical protein